MRRSFDRDLDDLPKAFEFAAEFYEAQGVEERHRTSIDLAIEEIFTNMIRHQPDADGEISIELVRRDRAVDVSIVACGVEPFDVTAVAEPDLELPLERRRVGGLGLHLTRRLMTTMRYEHERGTSRITMSRDLD